MQILPAGGGKDRMEKTLERKNEIDRTDKFV
jgi:hypothetical protein